MRTYEPIHLRWPAERFYWSVVDAPAWRRGGMPPAGVRLLFAEDVPADPHTPQDLHAVCAPLGDGRLVVCAFPTEALRALDAQVRTLCPESIPDLVTANIDPERLNLLVADLEPAFLRSARLRRHAVAAAVVLICASLVTAGMLRRAGHWNRIADDAALAHDAAIRHIGAGKSDSDLAAELARLRSAGEVLARAGPAPDAALALSGLLKAWPADVPSRPQSLVVTGSQASISVIVDGDAAPFLHALRPPRGWTLEEPRLNTAGQATRLALSLRRTEVGDH